MASDDFREEPEPGAAAPGTFDRLLGPNTNWVPTCHANVA
jgi:hypothetical protein